MLPVVAPKFPIPPTSTSMFLPRLGVAGLSRRLLSSPSLVSSRLSSKRLALTPAHRAVSVFATFPRPAVARLGIAPGLRSYATPRAARRAVKGQLSGEQWPWHVVANPPVGMEEIERVIFARGNKTLGKTFWAMAIIFTFGIVNWVLLPSPHEAIEKGIKPEKERNVMGLPLETFFTWVTGGWVAICGAIAVGGLFMMSRFVSRLSLVQQKAVNAPPAKARKFLRMGTAVQGVLPFFRTPREVPIAAVQVELLRGRKTRSGEREVNPYLKLSINDPNASAVLRLLDRVATYRLDFSENDLSGDGEMVLSMQRLEDVFGGLDYSQGR
ncbi:hypothetical protein CspeluHIS016_0204530 [Cutaneotrichosporon spelunceum]|uniref:Uncharacterized protein n=1 Tax=Cutaneotrichosporon spelunceum TaxID=1672016 RepID=A0AAD3TRA2_9TREE|nr:hypothetical protein CspeluHIS016_0204530 [Cutaneotrichosporon spelunceum]